MNYILESARSCKIRVTDTECEFDARYYVLGEEHDQVILFVHGLSSCSLFAAPFLNKLAAKFKVVSFDLPYHG